jgi:chlorite dismutase
MSNATHPSSGASRPAAAGRPAGPGGPPPDIQRQFVTFAFFKVAPEWRRLSTAERDAGKREWAAVIEKFEKLGMLILSYSLVGTRGDADILLWRISERLDLHQRMTTQLLHTGLGLYVTQPYHYLSMTKRSMYVAKHVHEGQGDSRGRIVPGGKKYLFVYPFWKTPEWYALPVEDRQRMMNEHIATGHRFPGVKVNTTYSFGLDDPEFVVAFEGDDPAEFLDLVMVMRENAARKYTLRDTPIFTCIRGTTEEVLNALG